MEGKVTVGVIGAGRIGKVHIGNICTRLPQAHVAWVCDLLIDQDSAMSSFVRQRVPAGCRLTADYKQVLADPSVVAILVLTSTNAHVPICLAAIAAGKHVFCEKPVAMSIDETRAVGQAARAAGVLFQVGFNRRFDHNFRKIRDTVASGAVGDLTVVHVISRDPTYDLHYIKRSIEEGGMFVDMTIHDFDMVQYVAGRSNPVVEVYAVGGCLVAKEDIGSLGDVDTAVVTLKLKSGAMATIDNTRKALYGYDQRLEALGTKGMIGCDNDRPTTCRMMLGEGLSTEEDRIHWWFLERYPDAFVAELREFFALVSAGKKGVETPVTCDDMVRAMLVANAANQSLKTGLPVKVPQI